MNQQTSLGGPILAIPYFSPHVLHMFSAPGPHPSPKKGGRSLHHPDVWAWPWGPWASFRPKSIGEIPQEIPRRQWAVWKSRNKNRWWQDVQTVQEQRYIPYIYIWEGGASNSVVQNSYDSLTSFYNIISNYIYFFLQAGAQSAQCPWCAWHYSARVSMHTYNTKHRDRGDMYIIWPVGT